VDVETVGGESVGPVGDGMNYMTVVPDGGVPEDQKRKVDRVIYEGGEEVKLDGPVSRPSGQSQDPDNIYFWKMSKDKRTIDVVIPMPDDVKKEDLIYRVGEDPENDLKRGPPLELGYRYRNEQGRFKEKLIIDGHILNAINRDDSYWMIEDMAGVKCCLLTLTRPSMMRQRHDPILRRSYEEERIEPQTWDALLVEERIKPEITDRVFFDMTLAGEPAGRLEFGLFGELLPRTVKNFLGLVTGEYTDEDGEVSKSAHCYKGTALSQIKSEFLISGGNAGLDLVVIEFTVEELEEYVTFLQDFRMSPKKVGRVEKYWSIRWGADLGMPTPGEDERRTQEGAAVDGNSDAELADIILRMRDRVDRGEGGKYIFYRPEWEKGCDVSGGTFKAEEFKVPHSKRGILSMDRNVEKDLQGSNFFILLKEFPEMDKKWVAFGEVTEGWDLLATLEEDWEGKADQVKIEDCGVLE